MMIAVRGESSPNVSSLYLRTEYMEKNALAQLGFSAAWGRSNEVHKVVTRV